MGSKRDDRFDLLWECTDDPALVDNLSTKEIGRLGEQIARAYMESRGYVVEACGYRCREGEADLIVLDGDSGECVLVEVKTRRAPADEVVYPELAVDERKRARYARIAACYVLENFPVFAVRFDVVAVTLRPGFSAEIEHLFSAFEWDGDR